MNPTVSSVSPNLIPRQQPAVYRRGTPESPAPCLGMEFYAKITVHTPSTSAIDTLTSNATRVTGADAGADASGSSTPPVVFASASSLAAATLMASATRGGEAIIAAEAPTFCVATAVSGSAPSVNAASAVLAENIALAPELEPVTYPPMAPTNGMKTRYSGPSCDATSARCPLVPLAAISPPRMRKSVVVIATGPPRRALLRTSAGTASRWMRSSQKARAPVTRSHRAGLDRMRPAGPSGSIRTTKDDDSNPKMSTAYGSSA